MMAGVYVVSIHVFSIVVTLWFSLTCFPWGWVTQRLKSAVFKLGRWCYRYAPPQLQVAWQTISYIEYRLAGILLSGILATWLWLGFGEQVHGVIVVTIWTIAGCLAVPLYRALRQLQHRKARVIAALPAQLDLLAMLLVAGQPLLISLQQSSSSGIDNPLREELRHVVSQVRAGVAVDLAFQRLSARYPCRELRLFCSALHHARESGAGLAGILYEQAEQRRQELFLHAEKKAMEAPVKLMFPLLIFIFPGTVLVLVVTLAAKMMWNL